MARTKGKSKKVDKKPKKTKPMKIAALIISAIQELKETKGSTPTGDEMDRANKIAERFARLPTPVPSNLDQAQKKGENSVRGATAESFGDTRRIESRRPDPITMQRRVQSLPASPATSMSEISWGHGDYAMHGSDFE
ncbi:Protein of unknown function [Cotesia congregata]|uniref:Uncharacterized protein n=1 Tax=Cotesia congregata TaxID=51543 RepID=A0A8J2MU11_COTCN|nr:Protein of unknown function [Cotesia congregata]